VLRRPVESALAAAVGVEDHALVGSPGEEGHSQGILDQLGAHVVGQRPADDPATGQVDDRRQVGPALPGHDVGDVAHVAAVELGARAEVPLDQVLRPLGLRIGHRRYVVYDTPCDQERCNRFSPNCYTAGPIW